MCTQFLCVYIWTSFASRYLKALFFFKIFLIVLLKECSLWLSDKKAGKCYADYIARLFLYVPSLNITPAKISMQQTEPWNQLKTVSEYLISYLGTPLCLRLLFISFLKSLLPLHMSYESKAGKIREMRA